MNSSNRVVFDCDIFAQALINPKGPAGACIHAVFEQHVCLVLSDFILHEIREIPNKPTPRKLGVNAEQVESLISILLECSEFITVPPAVFFHPIDTDDSEYVNLALAADAKLIVSRDRHLLNLNNPSKPWAADFRLRFPALAIISPEILLARLRGEGLTNE